MVYNVKKKQCGVRINNIVFVQTTWCSYKQCNVGINNVVFVQTTWYTGVLAETLRLPMALIHRYHTHIIHNHVHITHTYHIHITQTSYINVHLIHSHALGGTKDTMADKIILFSLVLGAVNISICLTGRASMRNT